MNYIPPDPYPSRTFNILYAVFTSSLNLRIFTELGTCPLRKRLVFTVLYAEFKIRKFWISCCELDENSTFC